LEGFEVMAGFNSISTMKELNEKLKELDQAKAQLIDVGEAGSSYLHDLLESPVMAKNSKAVLEIIIKSVSFQHLLHEMKHKPLGVQKVVEAYNNGLRVVEYLAEPDITNETQPVFIGLLERTEKTSTERNKTVELLASVGVNFATIGYNGVSALNILCDDLTSGEYSFKLLKDVYKRTPFLDVFAVLRKTVAGIKKAIDIFPSTLQDFLNSPDPLNEGQPIFVSIIQETKTQSSERCKIVELLSEKGVNFGVTGINGVSALHILSEEFVSLAYGARLLSAVVKTTKFMDIFAVVRNNCVGLKKLFEALEYSNLKDKLESTDTLNEDQPFCVSLVESTEKFTEERKKIVTILANAKVNFSVSGANCVSALELLSDDLKSDLTGKKLISKISKTTPFVKVFLVIREDQKAVKIVLDVYGLDGCRLKDELKAKDPENDEYSICQSILSHVPQSEGNFEVIEMVQFLAKHGIDFAQMDFS
jgi:hypothetical protein